MSWLDKFLTAVKFLQNGGVTLPQRDTINFGAGLTASDDAVNGRTNVSAGAAPPVYPLVDPSVQGLSSFTPDTLAPLSTAMVDSEIFTGQTTSGAHTGVVLATIPLPGTGGAPCSTGVLELDVEVSMVSTTTTDAARFKLTWQWSVRTPGSPVAMGVLTTSLAVGTAIGGTVPPTGWAAHLVLDGGSDNALITVDGDAALTVHCKALAQWGYTK